MRPTDRSQRRVRCLTAAIGLLAWALAGPAARGAKPSPPKPGAAGSGITPAELAPKKAFDVWDVRPRVKAADLPWLPTLHEARDKGLAADQPTLVFVRSTRCPWCERMEEEMNHPEVREALARWILVRLDAEQSPDEAGSLGVVAVPALRALSSGGLPIGARDGYVPAGDLAKWLAERWAAARASPDAVLLGQGQPNMLDAVKLVRLLEDRRPELREAAIRRLMPYPKVAGRSVLTALADGKLAQRLAALEVLEHWGAPVSELDPWRPDTITKVRLEQLKEWMEKYVAGPDQPLERPLAVSHDEAAGSLDRLAKVSPVEARALIERLARFGPALLREVVQRLALAQDDETVLRLRTLRYRLLATDSLVLSWPGGIECLASTDAEERHRAASELVARCGPGDHDLLVELFSDSDPLVREISLQGLTRLDVTEAREALVRLLDDPEPNVRAAVLKELAEQPVSAPLASAVARYVRQERDADLVVHAVRVLRKVESAGAVHVLIELLDHAAWQVRAEAAEALGEAVEPFGLGGSRPSETAAVICAALLTRLSDPDSFVVSRAVEALQGMDMAVAVEPLLRAARSHPDLVENIIGILLSGESMRSKAIPHLTAFVKHDDAKVSAAALRALASAAPTAMAGEVTDALASSSREVRVAAAGAVLASYEKLRQNAQAPLVGDLGAAYGGSSWSGGIDRRKIRAIFERYFQQASAQAAPTEDEKARSKERPSEQYWAATWDIWLEKHLAEKDEADVVQRRERLESMLSSGDNEERATAAAALICMGRSDPMIRVLAEAVAADRSLARLAGAAMPWMLWPQRIALFETLRSELKAEEERAELWEHLAQGPDPRLADYLWRTLAAETLSDPECYAVCRVLREAYGTAAGATKMMGAAKARVDQGSPQQQLLALLLLAETEPVEAASQAARLANKDHLSATLRRDAFQVFLATAAEKEATERAIAALASSEAERRKLAVRYLADGVEAVQVLHDAWWIGSQSHTMDLSGNAKPIVPLAPAGLKAQDVRPLLDDADPETSAAAGYLLALLGEDEGLQKLLVRWRNQSPPVKSLDRLLYRAVAALDDAAKAAELREIYQRLDSYEVSEFYWTIRIMSGEEVLKLRKEIRDKVGMSELR